MLKIGRQFSVWRPNVSNAIILPARHDVQMKVVHTL
jgi:hypothetical protein